MADAQEVERTRDRLVRETMDQTHRMDRCVSNLRRLMTDLTCGRVTNEEFEAERTRYVFLMNQPDARQPGG